MQQITTYAFLVLKQEIIHVDEIGPPAYATTFFLDRSPKRTRRNVDYGTKNSSGRPSKLNDREKGKFCGLCRITRSASMKSVGHVPLMPQNLRCGEC
uniref:Uncharacterized protein n=1 Tax=Heterorhabditis bacteriophora TaxID=37862 RepID=A0A1I7WXN6_HETBA